MNCLQTSYLGIHLLPDVGTFWDQLHQVVKISSKVFKVLSAIGAVTGREAKGRGRFYQQTW